MVYKYYETIISPKIELAQTKSLSNLIKRVERLLFELKSYKKNNVKYNNMDHMHQFITTNKKLAKKFNFIGMKEEE